MKRMHFVVDQMMLPYLSPNFGYPMIFEGRNPFYGLVQFSNIPLLDNEFMNVGWHNYAFPGNRFINMRMDIRINEL